eukprot:g6844.t1
MIGCGGGEACTGRSAALVEAVDIMPTVLEEAGVVPPTPLGAASAVACPPAAHASRGTPLCTEGRSLSAVLRAPRAPAHGGTDASAPFGAAYSQFPRPEHSDKGTVDVACRDAGLTRCNSTSAAAGGRIGSGWCNATGECPNKMGYTVRTDRYRYTAWVPFYKCAGPACPPVLADWERVLAVELYNHSAAPVPQDYLVETENIAGRPGSAAVERELHALLRAANTR